MKGLELYKKVRVVPKEAQKAISGGRLNGKTDINPMWRIKVLTEQFGPCGFGWYYITTNNWLEQSGNEVAAFVKIELFVKYGEEWSKPISGTGGSMFVTKENNGLHVSDECYKMATTDAISVACKQLGIGADVYWKADSTKYDKPEPTKEAPKLSKEQVGEIYKELKRTGISRKSLLEQYNVEAPDVMTIEQFNAAIKILKSRPDKPIDPATVPPDNASNGLPWGDKKE
ncbi:hypothetical protein [Lacrimispora sp.]|uniref:hypothetical protein n=1 Tax=Lacrimispora sp. TaxID=2719234 RepID=UPI0028A93A60|nr:hypothetical protein [Lacrimispora sp.]